MTDTDHNPRMDNQYITPAHVGDAISAGAIVGTFMGWLPVIAAVVAIIWYVIQIYESKTVQHWLHKRRVRREQRKRFRKDR